MSAGLKKITILYVEGAAAFGGSAVVMGHLVKALDKSKFRAVVVGEMDPSVLRNLIKGSAKLYITRRHYNYVLWGRTVKKIDLVPGRYVRKLLTYLFSILRSLINTIYILRMVFILIKEDVDIVHINNGMTDVEAIVAARLTACKYVVHLQQIKQPGLIQKILVKTVSKFIAISEYIKNEMAMNFIPERNIEVIANPVKPEVTDDINSESLRDKYGIEQDDVVFGIVGRIVRWKGHEEFLKATKKVLESVAHAKVLVVGDCSDGDRRYQENLISLVDSYGLKDRVIFTGYIEDVGGIYGLLDVFVHTSIRPEPFGLVITEAMAYGVPVIAANSGATSEIICDGENGFLVDPLDTEKLAGTIIALLNDEPLRCRVGNSGKKHVLQKYQVDDYARAVERVYLKVLGRVGS